MEATEGSASGMSRKEPRGDSPHFWCQLGWLECSVCFDVVPGLRRPDQLQHCVAEMVDDPYRDLADERFLRAFARHFLRYAGGGWGHPANFTGSDASLIRVS
jgi:hypothetical protein